MPSRSARSLWFSFNFDSSIICFIISCWSGCPPGAAGWAALELDPPAGDVDVVCANEEVASKVANRITVSGIDIFMAGFWQRLATIGK